MEKNPLPNAGKNMARDEEATHLDPDPAVPADEARALMPPPPSVPPKKEPIAEFEPANQHMVALKPKFLPNLKSLMFPKMVYEQTKRLVITPLLTYNHDPVAALKLRGARCASFELPNDMFPRGAPIWKITFLPEELLPMGFDAGGVFGTGVLARKYYPTDLLSAEHKGQTPPLFIGHRSSSYVLPKGVLTPAQAQAQAKGNGRGRGQAQAPPKRIQPLTPAPPPSPAFKRSILKPSAAVTAEMNRRLALNNISVIEMVIMPAFRKPPSRYPMAVPMQMQYNMYAPDLSKVIFAMQDIDQMTVAIISTVHQPNVPEVALSTMGNEACPRFELPADIFPVDTNRLGPRFLPQRFLPDFCDAGCVFPPGSLPDSVFHGAMRTHFDLEQHHYSMTPPLFVGRRKQPPPQCGNGAVQVPKIDSIAMQLKKLALRNMAATKQSNANTAVPIPESTKRSNEFKMSVAAGRPKGFVLIESDRVPRGAIRTDFFGAFLMGCFFKIVPDVKCIFESLYGTDTDDDDDDTDDDDEELYFRHCKGHQMTVLKADKASQAGEMKSEEVEAKDAGVEGKEAAQSHDEEAAAVAQPEAEKAEVEKAAAAAAPKKPEVEEPETEGSEAEVEAETNSEDYETEEYIADGCDCGHCESEEYEAEEVDSGEYEANKCAAEEERKAVDYNSDEWVTDELDEGKAAKDNADEGEAEAEETVAEQTKGENTHVVITQKDDSNIAQPLAKKSNLSGTHTSDDENDNTDSTKPECPGCAKIYSYFTVDSNLDDIAEAAGDLNTARFEVIVHPSELPGINVERAVEQFRQVLQCRNEIRAKMTGMINAHVTKMEANNKPILASPAPVETAKRTFRKPCTHCGKHH
ncbi:hypothetical protein KR032_003081 [Drosophila birchii]|nr:hypothetical protein KR032_003081 [Drosophila birchii]